MHNAATVALRSAIGSSFPWVAVALCGAATKWFITQQEASSRGRGQQAGNGLGRDPFTSSTSPGSRVRWNAGPAGPVRSQVDSGARRRLLRAGPPASASVRSALLQLAGEP